MPCIVHSKEYSIICWNNYTINFVVSQAHKNLQLNILSPHIKLSAIFMIMLFKIYLNKKTLKKDEGRQYLDSVAPECATANFLVSLIAT